MLVVLSFDVFCILWVELDSVFYSFYVVVIRRVVNGEVVGLEEVIMVGMGLLVYIKDVVLMGGFEENGILVVGKNVDFVIVD